MTRKIQFCYRKIIDIHSTKEWEQLVFEDTHMEFKIQSHLFNEKKIYNSFTELIALKNGAEKLHHLVSAAAIGYIRQLNNTIPDVLNVLGKHFLPFRNFQFEIINSDIHDKKLHTVAINFISNELIWLDTIGSKLIVKLADAETTETLELIPFLSIYNYSLVI